MRIPIRRLGVLLAVLAGALLLLPIVGSLLFANTAMLGHARPSLIWAERAFSLNDNPISRWVMVRALIVDGQESRAARLLAGTDVDVGRMSRGQRDAIALIYANQGEIAKAKSLLPENPYANYVLWAWTGEDSYGDKVRFPSKLGIESEVSYLSSMLSKAIPDIVSRQLWSPDQAYAMQSFLAWSGRDSEDGVMPSVANIDRSLITTGSNVDAMSFWHWDEYLGANGNQALFVTGSDDKERTTAVRLMGLWEKPTPPNQPRPYAQYISQPLSLTPNRFYDFSLGYKTDGDAVATVALMDYASSAGYAFVHVALPSTGGQWKTWSLRGTTPDGDLPPVRLLVRTTGIGSVWFDEIRLVQIQAPRFRQLGWTNSKRV